MAALQLCSKSLTSSLGDWNVWDNPHVPREKNAVRAPALLPSRAEHDELKWLISIIWLVQLHKHAPILASVSIFFARVCNPGPDASDCLSCQINFYATHFIAVNGSIYLHAGQISSPVRLPPGGETLFAFFKTAKGKKKKKRKLRTRNRGTPATSPEWTLGQLKSSGPGRRFENQKKRHLSNTPGSE